MFLYMLMCSDKLDIWKSFSSCESVDFSGLNLISIAPDYSAYCELAFLASLVNEVRSKMLLTFSTIVPHILTYPSKFRLSKGRIVS